MRYRRNKGSQTATSVKAVEPANARSRRNRPLQQFRTSQAWQGRGRKAKEKSAAWSRARAVSAEACGGRAGWNPALPSGQQQNTPTGGGVWRARKRRRKRGVEVTRRKEAHEAEARIRSSGDGTRSKISTSTSSASAARSAIGGCGGGGSRGCSPGCLRWQCWVGLSPDLLYKDRSPFSVWDQPIRLTRRSIFKPIYASPNPLCISKFLYNRAGIERRHFALEERGS